MIYRPYKITEFKMPVKQLIIKSQQIEKIDNFIMTSFFATQNYQEFAKSAKEIEPELKSFAAENPEAAKRHRNIIKLIGLNKQNKILELYKALQVSIKYDPKCWHYQLLMVQIYIDLALHVNLRNKMEGVLDADFEKGFEFANKAFDLAKEAKETTLLPLILSYKQSLIGAYNRHEIGAQMAREIKSSFRSRLFHSNKYLNETNDLSFDLDTSDHLAKNDSVLQQIVNNLYNGIEFCERESEIYNDLLQGKEIDGLESDCKLQEELVDRFGTIKSDWIMVFNLINKGEAEQALAITFKAMASSPMNRGSANLCKEVVSNFMG